MTDEEIAKILEDKVDTIVEKVMAKLQKRLDLANRQWFDSLPTMDCHS